MKRLADQTLYEILEVPPDASGEEIAAAYDRARALYGPGSLVTYTLMEPDEAALLEARIEDARSTLLDPERRARYDEGLQRPVAERRAAAAGAASAPAPPVVPAALPLPAPEPESEPEAREDVEVEAGVEERSIGFGPDGPEEARPAILLEAALEAAGPAGGVAEGGPPRTPPILLRRQVAPAPAAPEAGSAAPDAEAAGPTRPAPAAARPGVDSAEAAPAAAPAPAPLPDAWTGDALREVREARGVSIQQIAERTKVTRHHIENVEADRFDALPAQVYLRGILLAIARELRLDGQKVARSYLERIAGASPPPPRGR